VARAFVDTNVLVYANDGRDPVKQTQAASLLEELAELGDCVFSTQVLHEYASVALAKLRLDPALVQQQVTLLANAEVVPLTADLICRAVDLHAEHHLSYWDACILVAAETAGCAELYSEDLNPGQSYAGVRVVNPFAG
jgi:predicted nucleic acid-binding protein